jgi:hypothetical protein
LTDLADAIEHARTYAAHAAALHADSDADSDAEPGSSREWL